MLPIRNTGLKKFGSASAGSAFYAERFGAVQTKPYNLDLPLAYRAGYNISGRVQDRPPNQVGDFPYTIGINLDSILAPTQEWSTVVNKARERFISQCKDSTSFGETIAQWRSTRDLLAKNLLEVGEFAAALLGGKKKLVGRLAKRREQRAKNSMRNFPNSGESARKGARNRDAQVKGWIQNPASAFIEGHFVWNPLFEDIRKLSGEMFRLIPLNRVKSSASIQYSRTERQDITSIEGKSANYHIAIKCKVSGRPEITNPELLALDGLGILNAPLLAWNLLPFSWLVDWFANVSDILGQLSDTRGYAIRQPSTTMICSGLSFGEAWYRPAVVKKQWYYYRVTKGLTVTRTLTFPSVSFTCSIPSSLSWQRGLTVASLMALIGLKSQR